MENTKKARTSQIGYEEVAAAFSKNAATLLPEDRIRHTLEEEERRFENAAALQISPIKFIGGNTARHCKELLRRSQPFFPLYMLSSLLTEGSLMLSAYLLLYAGSQHLFSPGKTISHPYPVLDGIIVIIGLLLFQYRCRSIWLGAMARTWHKPEQILPAVKKSRCLSGIMTLLFCAAGIFTSHAAGLASRFQMTLWDTLILYAGCAIFAGIHNLIFDSHIISFLTAGAELLDPRKIQHAPISAQLYLESALTQILEQGFARTAHLQENPSSPETAAPPENATPTEDAAPPEDGEQKKAKAILRTRLLSFRIYGALALFILLILTFLSISQLLRDFSLPLLAFSLGALLGSFLCILIFLSCRAILREL